LFKNDVIDIYEIQRKITLELLFLHLSNTPLSVPLYNFLFAYMIQTHNPKCYRKQKFCPCYTVQGFQKHNSETVVPWNISGNTKGQKLNVYMTKAGAILWPYSRYVLRQKHQQPPKQMWQHWWWFNPISPLSTSLWLSKFLVMQYMDFN